MMFSSILALLAASASALKCHPEGPILPKPTSLARSPIFTSAALNLTNILDAAIAGNITADGFSEFYFLKDLFLTYGLPPIDEEDYPPCGVTTLNKACNRQEILDGMKKSYPQTTPNERPAYSNMAFVLLGMALEEYTGKNFTQLLKEVTGPLEMSNTFPSPGYDDKAVIPPDSSWGSDYGLNTPAGGLVSSLSDLSKFSHALLSRTLPLTPSQINGWLKPSSFAGNAHTLSGMPWEILRLDTLTPEHPHTVTIYSKSGGAQNYRSQLSFIDEYGLAIVVLTAGPMKAAPILADAVISTFVGAADDVARVQAKRYERVYKNDDVEAVLEQDGDSMVLASLRRNGTDIVSSLKDVWGLTLGDFLPGIGDKIRVFPSELRDEGKEVWHLWPDLDAGFKTDLPGGMIEEMNCVGWTIQDWVHYGGEPLDRVLFHVENGVLGFEVPFLRSGVMYPSK
ncbi:uncharacterized protein FIESC28_05559 [Fusarium coffeatum]|uniref:Uncharacterized protein n=1 Tax=Fusarium coffeatum TaxID=231269 RepID=A0A366RR44_9HYPO|nr:uncharacterized protein FIESC28_05559 [Fusarium coffeatum]RBR19564.1 hypothetical protein FIESC28_05559 [Fusarium coffeatum]